MNEGIFLGAPPGQSWPLTATGLELLLRDRHPTAFLRVVIDSNGHRALDFDLPLADNDTHGGSYSETGVLALADGTPELWADTITWFLTLLPADAPVYGMREDNPTPVCLPSEARTDQTTLVAFFEQIADPDE